MIFIHNVHTIDMYIMYITFNCNHCRSKIVVGHAIANDLRCLKIIGDIDPAVIRDNHITKKGM